MTSNKTYFLTIVLWLAGCGGEPFDGDLGTGGTGGDGGSGSGSAGAGAAGSGGSAGEAGSAGAAGGDAAPACDPSDVLQACGACPEGYHHAQLVGPDPLGVCEAPASVWVCARNCGNFVKCIAGIPCPAGWQSVDEVYVEGCGTEQPHNARVCVPEGS